MMTKAIFLKLLGIQLLLICILITLTIFLVDPFIDKIVTLKTESELFQSTLPQVDPHNDSQLLELHTALLKKDRVTKAYWDVFIFVILAGFAFAIPLALCTAWQYSLHTKPNAKKYFLKSAYIHFGLSLALILILSILFILLGKTAGMELVTIPIFIGMSGISIIGIHSLQIYVLKSIYGKTNFIKYRLQTIGLCVLGVLLWSSLLLISTPYKFIIQGFGFIILCICIILLLVREKYF